MAEHPHIDRKELKEPDAFMESVGRAVRYLQEHRQQVIAGASAVVLVFAGGVAWSAYSRSASDRTAAAFLRATDAVGLNSMATAKAALESVVEGGSGAYDEFALIYMADIQVKEDACSEAVDTYTRAADQARAEYVRQIALVGKAFCLERLERPAEAALAYREAGEIDGPHREQALRGQLRAAISAEDKQLATTAIERLLEHYPGSEDADHLAKQLEALKS